MEKIKTDQKVIMDINGIDNLGLERVLKRGSGQIIAERDDAVLIRDNSRGTTFGNSDRELPPGQSGRT